MTLLSDTNKFVTANSNWLTADHAPALATLKILAKQIDAQERAGEVTPSVMAQYGLTYRSLLALKVRGTKTEDDDDDLRPA